MIVLSVGDAPVHQWLEAIKVRHSRRTYDGKPIDLATLDALQGFCDSFKPSANVRPVLVRQAPPEIFFGVGAYGAVRNAPSAVVFVGPASGRHIPEEIGFVSGGLILEATSMGLSTCWVGGFFRARTTGRHANLRAGERVYGVTPIGTTAESISGAERVIFGMRQDRPKARKPIEEIAPGVDEHWPAWVHEGIAAARLAPSAYNRQPWRFRYENGRVKLSVEGADTPKVSKRIDCGIAMLHFEVAAREAGVPGRWELLDSGPDIAIYSAS